MTIYLYVKTHIKTGLKYLGQTTKKDPHKYTGSGTYWLRHLEKHGKDYSTTIVKECQSKDEVASWGVHYSNLWNVVDSKEWANLKPETGDGSGCQGNLNSMWGKTHTDEVKEKLAGCAAERFTGKSYEEIYGKEKADQLREKRSQDMKRVAADRDYSGVKNPRARAVHIKGKDFQTSLDAATHYGVAKSTVCQWIKKHEDCYFR